MPSCRMLVKNYLATGNNFSRVLAVAEHLPMKFEQLRSSPESEVVLCCSRTHLHAETIGRVTALLEQELDWEYLIRLAFVHGVLPLVYSSLREHWREAIPETISHQLQSQFKTNIQRNLLLTAELFKLLKVFEVHSLEAVPFKGPVLAAGAYGDVALRQFGDLDILVHRRDIVEAGKLVVSQGYEPNHNAGHAADDHESDPDEVAFLGPQYYTFNRPDGRSRVDLQWRISQEYFAFSLDSERLWERVEPVAIAGRTVRTFAPSDMLLILCIHGSKHCWEKLKWICDVAELVRRHARRIDWEEIQRQACKERIQRMLRLGLYLAQDLLGAELPTEISRYTDRDSKTKGVAREIRNKLFLAVNQPLGKFQRAVFYMKTKDHWHEGARFCLQYISQCCQAILIPSRSEKEILPLPKPLSFLYFFFRPLRLIAKHCRLVASRIYR